LCDRLPVYRQSLISLGGPSVQASIRFYANKQPEPDCSIMC